MIARLRGTLAVKGLDRLIVDVGGVGYDVMISLQTHHSLPEEGQDVLLLIHSHIREDSFSLLGFSTQDERELFRMLISISGIGPRMALNLLSHITPGEFVDTVKRENLKRLTAIPGIGKRKAERLIVELRDKLIDMDLGLTAVEVQKAESNKALARDLHSALVNFGYRASQVEKVVAMMETDMDAGADLEQLVMTGLQKLTKL